MKESTSQSQDVISVDHELCCQMKCANCFGQGGCIYEQYPASTVYLAIESNAVNELNDIVMPKRA